MKKLVVLAAALLTLGLSDPIPASAHAVYAGDALFACLPSQYVASRNAKLTGQGVAQAWTFPWRAGLYCEAIAPAREVRSATAIRHQVWVYPGWWYDCGFDYQADFGSSEADASSIPNPICENDGVKHRVLVSHSVWLYGEEFVNAYELYH